ncbi:MAG: ATP-binding protein, partial [Chloroflexota bacterium]|nr:ATP-binding protein [Chloroflexota bacterium]
AEMAPLLQKMRHAFKNDVPQTLARSLLHLPGEHGVKERYFTYTIVPTHEDDARVDGLIVYAEDVTEQMAREAEERREKLKVMVEHAEQVALALYDAQTTELVQASRRYLEFVERVHGYPQESITGMTWRETAFPATNQDPEELFRSVVERREVRRSLEVRLNLGEEGRESVWFYSMTPISFENGGGEEAVRFVAISAIEVTEQVRVRDDLERLDRMKDLFLSAASHELRTPLVPLMGYSDMLSRVIAQHESEPGWDRRISEYAGKFRKQLDHLGRMVDDLFDTTRLQTGKFTIQHAPVDLCAALDIAVEEAGMLGSKHEIVLDAPGDEPVCVLGDESRLVQVISNLLHNAIKYSPEKSRIDVRLRREQGDGGEMAVIEVQDYGQGVRTADLPSIFTRFYQATSRGAQATGGLGLGLFIAKSIVDEHKGTITATSVEGEGSTFTVRLPILAD